MSKNKLVVLDPESQTVYVFDYNLNIYEDAFDCIEAMNQEHCLNIRLNNCDFMEVENLTLKTF